MKTELRHSKDANSFGVSLSDDQDNNEVTTETRHRLLMVLGLFLQAFHSEYKDPDNIELFFASFSKTYTIHLDDELATPLLSQCCWWFRNLPFVQDD